MTIPVKPISELEVKSEVSASDKILILDSDTDEARLADRDELKGDKGDPGDPGTPGADGVAATITVGTVSTGAAGSSATVTNVGTSSAAVFNFSIPQGDTGDDGNGIASITSSKVGKTTTVTITETNGTVDTFEVQDGADGGGGSGSGDVVGPASSTDGHLAVFDGATGKLIKDGGAIPTAPVTSVNSQTGAVVLDADDISDSTTTNKFVTATDKTTWGNKQDALTLPATPTSGHLVTWGGNNKTLTDGGAIPTGVPAVGTNGQVLTVVSGVAAWADASGGDVMVSSQTGNVLTTGMKIWAGLETDYENLGTYDSNTLYLTIE